jgi:beta-glucosidase
MKAHNAHLLDVVPPRHLETAVIVNGRLLGRSFRAVMSVVTLALTTVVATTVIAIQSSGASQPRDHTLLEASTPTSTCPWIAESLQHSKSAQVMANEVIAMMTLAQKADFVILATYPPLENSDIGVPSLCIPPITLTDGPSGVANGLIGVTQFPAPIAVAATFNPSIARTIGVEQAVETRIKGIAVVQGPELNLARVPQSGRIFETYGEDPYLTSVLGVANVNGIQSTGDLANAKHYSAYTQETARLRLNQIIRTRALAELYDAPFKAVVQQAHVASLMCSYGELNGVNTCSDPSIYATLKSWGFTGFVRSDLGAVANMAQAFRAGMSLMKPGSPATLVRLVQQGSVTTAQLNQAVRSVLVPMFNAGLIAHPLHGSLTAVATTPAHAATALSAATQSIVLLKNQGSILPLGASASSIAVIGTDAGQTPQVTGGGSSKVQAPYVITPLSALRSMVSNTTKVTYEPGGPPTLDLDQLSDVDIVKGTPLKLVKPIAPIGEAGKADIAIEKDPSVTPAIATATEPGTGRGWDKWSMVIKAKATGTYEITFQQYGDTWLYLDKKPFISSAGLHAPADLSATTKFVAGDKYTFTAQWFQIKHHAAPTFSLLDVTPLINKAVQAARKAKVAIVFAGNYDSEGVDIPNLSLPSDFNGLIDAVAAVNPHTIVVVNTGGAVVMPWLSKVAGVLEAWYPGQEDGTAIARVLTGRFNPSGRLPLTFPTSTSAMPATSDTSFPGVNATVNFGTGLDVGYRWYQANKVTPLFSFGYGESYTTFKLSNATLTKTTSGVTIRVKVTNTGSRSGTDVVQAYAANPSSTGEPPEQLRGFQRVVLNPSASKNIVMVIPSSGFQVFVNNSWKVVPGAYRVDVGQSSADLPIHLNVTM